MRIPFAFRLAGSAVVFLLLPVGARSQESTAPPGTVSPASSRRGPSDPAEIEAFFDGLMIGQMREKNVAGATLSVVRDGQILFAKGYGYADLATHRPVSPDSALFRIGSISKLFTWTAVMQQVEAGRLELDRDINEYLDFAIPATYEQPITMFNLLTHTPGFEDRGFALFSESETPRGEFLAAHMPARVRPPGTYVSYSNYGAALAGYIVERVSGEDWETYIERHILEPLGIRNATGRQPLPAALAPQMSVGYASEGGELVAKPFEVLLPFAPAGSMSASATAMARFMIAMLQHGEYDGARILSDSIARFMQSRAFAQDPRLDGYDYGFYEQTSHGVHLIGHGGDTQWFHSDLSIAPEEGWGVFVSYNSAPGGSLSFGSFLQAVLDHYYPVETASMSEAPDSVNGAYLGSYRVNRMSYTTLEKATGLASSVTVRRHPKHAGVLVVSSPLGKARFIAAGNDLFREIDGTETIAFQRDDNGKVTHFFMSGVPMIAMERSAWYDSPIVNQVLLAVNLVLLLTVPFVMLAGWLLRRRFRELPPPARGARLARWTSLLATVVAIAFCVGFISVVSNQSGLIKGDAGGLDVVLALPILLAILAAIMLVFTARAWKKGWWGRWGRVHYTLVSVAAVILIGVLAHWNLLGWRY